MVNLNTFHKQLQTKNSVSDSVNASPKKPVKYERKKSGTETQSLQHVLSKLSPKVIKLIEQKGHGKFKSRSERDIKLMGYLKGYNLNLETVVRIFMNYPCGAKAREKSNPRDYLERTYKKAVPIKKKQYKQLGKAFNSKEFIDQYLGTKQSKMLYRNFNFYQYNGHYYEVIKAGAIKRDLYDFMGYKLSHSRLKSILDLLKTGLDDPSVLEPMNQLNFPNGVLNMDTKQLSPHSDSLFFTSMYPFNYDPTADCPNYKQFLKYILGNDPNLLAFDQEWLAYMLTFYTSLQRFRINIGEGANGKSTHYKVMMAIVGKEYYHNGMLSIIWSPREAHILQGMKVLFAEELNYLGQVNSARLKEAVDGYIHCNPKYEDPFSFKNTAKFIVNTNELPNSADPTFGMARRMIIVNYNTIIPEKDRDSRYYEKYLEPELAGIMNYALEGYDRLVAQKHFTKCSASEHAVQKYMRESSPVKLFVAEECILGPNQRIQKQKLFKAFIKFCEEYNFKQNYSYIRFARELNSYCCQMNSKLRTSDTTAYNERVKIYIGIDLINPID